MKRPWQRPAVSAAVAALTATVLAAGVAACGNNNSPSSVASGIESVASGAASVASGAASAASGAASAAASVGAKATGAAASASASAQKKIDDIKGGTNVKSDVTLAAPAIKNGRSTVDVTVRNTADSTKSFAVKVDYKDTSGNLLDTVVVTLSDVPAGQSKSATAQSNRDLTGEVKTDVSQALRY
ncbi:FxLYD domain-containing protein [Streptomyces tsukubensis]|uniref:FxLYD domain-containing protein n=1 Tax=Streptomyces tsukubensis TaxID=83656 RepID=UPI0036867896